MLGDRTSHGGTVVEASQVTFTHNKPIARVGDQVTCPIPGHGTTVIVEGDPTMILDGKPVARHGDKCACGAVLISSQVVSSIGSGGAGGHSGSPSSPTSSKSSAAAPASTSATAESASSSSDPHQEEHDHRFALTCSLTGMPLAGQPYRLKANGKVIEGVTDKDGLTQPIGTETESSEVECEILGEVIDG